MWKEINDCPCANLNYVQYLHQLSGVKSPPVTQCLPNKSCLPFACSHNSLHTDHMQSISSESGDNDMVPMFFQKFCQKFFLQYGRHDVIFKISVRE